MSVTFQFDLDPALNDAVRSGDPHLGALAQDLSAAGEAWSKALIGNGTITVVVHDATFSDGRSAETHAQFVHTGLTDPHSGLEILNPLAELHAMSTGTQGHLPDGPDMIMWVDTKLITTQKNIVPHLEEQIGHGLGVDGFPTSPFYESSYDAHLHKTEGDIDFFVGTHAGQVPLAPDDPYHFAVDRPDVMNSSVPPLTTVSPVDLEVLADIGYDINPFYLPSG
jgi:hypothetical protein